MTLTLLILTSAVSLSLALYFGKRQSRLEEQMRLLREGPIARADMVFKTCCMVREDVNRIIANELRHLTERVEEVKSVTNAFQTQRASFADELRVLNLDLNEAIATLDMLYAHVFEIHALLEPKVEELKEELTNHTDSPLKIDSKPKKRPKRGIRWGKGLKT